MMACRGHLRVTRVHVSRRGVVTGTLASRHHSAIPSTISWRCYSSSSSSYPPHQPHYSYYPPPPPPPQSHYYAQQHQQQQQQQPGEQSPNEKPVAIQIKPTRLELARQILTLGLLASLLGFVAHWSLAPPNNSKLMSGRSTMGGEAVKEVDLKNFDVTFSEVMGCDEAKAELEEIVLFLKDPTRFTRLGGKLPKGALLVGPPGTGKTMLAKAIAKEAGVPFFYMSGAEFDEMFVGVGSRRVRDLFEAAKKAAPALIFIDELDAIGTKRSPRDQSYHRMTLNQMLSEMDGFLSSDKVIVLAATNTPKSLDRALTRPGRFDRIIAVDLPDVSGREKILKLYLSKVSRADNIDALQLARGLPGFSGADLQNIVNIAAIRAAMKGKNQVEDDDLDYARDRVSIGTENRSKVVPEKERKITAWHEAGHALVALLTKSADPVHKATIVPRGSGVLGLVLQHPLEDKRQVTKEEMHARLKVALGGRAAEEVYLGAGDVTAGAASDFERATSLARTMVRRFGMGGKDDLGVVDYSTTDDADGAFLSDDTKEMIEAATKKLLDQAFHDAKKLLEDNHTKLKAVAEGLLVHETLTGAQLQLLVQGKKLPAPEKKKTDTVSPDPKAVPAATAV